MPLLTPLHTWHSQNGARMVDFGGWDMPVQYTSIVDEHQAVRNQAGIFDISHMGRLFITGPDACKFLQLVCTNDIATLAEGQVRYSLVCNDAGTILDDILVYKLKDQFLLVVNASNRTKIVDWLIKNKAGFQVNLDDKTLITGMVAIQGPKAMEIADHICSEKASDLKYYFCRTGRLFDSDAIISRTGYTGEDGIEFIIPNESLEKAWIALISMGLKPCGLGCRDTLRLEAGMPLYGHEIDEQTNPLEAGLGWAVKMNQKEFIGKKSLSGFESISNKRTRVGIEVLGRRIPREGCLLFHLGQEVGKVCSGTFSPTFQKPLAMGYLPANLAKLETEIEVDIRGNREKAKVVPIPFYKRPKN